MKAKRKAGVLLAVSALPSKHGIGGFGQEAVDFIHLLKKNGWSIWQILPLNPLGYGHSPYQPLSSFAIDEIYIDLSLLQKQGLIKKVRDFHPKATKVDYEAVRAFKEPYLQEAYHAFLNQREGNQSYQKFCQAEWLDNYVLFRALKKQNHEKSWLEWEYKEDSTMVDQQLLDEMDYQRFLQFILFDQWQAVLAEAHRCGITIMGDVPFYVGLDSADVWGNQEYFLLDQEGQPTFIAGVPPDYFSETGQRWGNPIYNWEKLEEKHFDFWLRRLGWIGQCMDHIRIDHFRAFDTYWKIPASCPTAIEGSWEEAPGYALFDALFKAYPKIDIVAEDLGLLRPEVYVLRDHYGFKGMKIIQFTYDKNQGKDQMEDQTALIAYTGTHDNETLKSWCQNFTLEERKIAHQFLKKKGCSTMKLTGGFIEVVLRGKTEWSILAAQDLLELDQVARINIPGEINEVNWCWKCKDFIKLSEKLAEWEPMLWLTERHN